MSISAIGGAGGAPVFQTVGDPALRQIDKQIEQLQKKISETKANDKMDETMKSQLIAEYQRQIQELQAQKSQKQMEQNTEALRPEKVSEEWKEPIVEPVKTREQEEQDKAQDLDKSTMAAFAQVGRAKEASKALAGPRLELEGKLRVASTGSYGREPDPVATKEIATQLGVVNQREIGAWQKASDAVGEAQAERAEQAGQAVGPDRTLEDRQVREEQRQSEKEQAQEERRSGGTGRMEPGQFLYEEV